MAAANQDREEIDTTHALLYLFVLLPRGGTRCKTGTGPQP